MDPEKLIRRYLANKHVMQLATAKGTQPWCCSVWYVSDDSLNIYWASWPSRRHSQEIAENSQVAAAIAVQDPKHNQAIGIQIEGSAGIVTEPGQIQPIAKKYATKFGFSDSWVEKFSNSKTKHKLYKLTPRTFVLFDEENFPPGTRLELNL